MKKAKPNPKCKAPDCRCSLVLGDQEHRLLESALTQLTVMPEVLMAMGRELIKVPNPKMISLGIKDTKDLINQVLTTVVPAIEMLNAKFKGIESGELTTEIDLSPEAIATWKQEREVEVKKLKEQMANNPLAVLLGIAPPPPGATPPGPKSEVLGLNMPRLKKGDIPEGPSLN